MVVSLYAKGTSNSEIVETFNELSHTDISSSLIFRVTDMEMEQVEEWQLCPLFPIYLIVCLDCLVVKICQDKKVINKAIYLALAVNLERKKSVWVYGFRKMGVQNFS